ncbi:hypothetical protein DMR_31900 [Solidesulfovibrio magneticus RS-1]|uniref:Uncharacterized protein n=1 Tax=Solidesulfovibrio magneticus (strain ATCC 700980 / DSM 13731 / RS-1) TaxID=573370 RepID=C4XJD1_SOLM1|nr:hypothetical protein DMR_31900 [Solidesulfovibrio magneticus RS-1]
MFSVSCLLASLADPIYPQSPIPLSSGPLSTCFVSQDFPGPASLSVFYVLFQCIERILTNLNADSAMIVSNCSRMRCVRRNLKFWDDEAGWAAEPK